MTVMNTASEGGAWGIALLAAYRIDRQPGETLDMYLDQRIFAHLGGVTLSATSGNAGSSESSCVIIGPGSLSKKPPSMR